MKVALVCFLLFAVCFAQDAAQERIVGDTLSLTTFSAAGTDLHSERNNTVEGVVARSGCQETVHSIRNVATGQGPLNSGSYFSVEIVNDGVDAVDINLTFGEEIDDDDETIAELFMIRETIDGTISGTVGICEDGDTCTFIYTCEQFPDSSTLEVVLFTDAATDDTDTAVTYSLTVTQFIEEVVDMGDDRVFVQNQPIELTFDDTIIGPQNYAQYYHELELSTAEFNDDAIFYVILSDFEGADDTDPFNIGEVIVCVSLNSIVGNVEPAGNVDDFPAVVDENNEGDVIPNSGDDCDSFCVLSEIELEGDVVAIALSPCADFDCDQTNLWIGVRPPPDTPASFTITLRPEETLLPTMTVVEDTPFSAEGEVTGDCGSEGFSCEDYFVINSETDFPSPDDDRLGPFLSINVFGPLGGDIEFEVSMNTLGGDKACTACGASLFTCAETLTGNGAVTCQYTLQPCQYDPTVDYVVSVTGSNADDADLSIVYGIDVTLDSYSVEEVNPISTVFGSVVAGEQNHYTVTFDEEEINNDSYFEVELYIPNSNGNRLALAWNFDEPAGDGTCYQSLGVCQTDLDCDDFEGNTDLAMGAVPSCRFVYQDCDVQVSEQFARDGVDETDFSSGLRVSELKAGTYWFNVYSLAEDSSENIDTSVEYTLKFNLRRSIPIFDDLVTLGTVFFAETSPQYVFQVPSTPSVSEYVITVDNVRNGGIEMLVACGESAGECPCGTSMTSCTANSAGDSRCQVRVPRCMCDDESLHIAFKGAVLADSTVYGFSSNQPIYFALSVEAYDKNALITPLPATRAGTTVSSSLIESSQNIRDVEFYEDSSNYASIFEVTFDNVDVAENDALFITVSILDERSLNDVASGEVFQEAPFVAISRHAVYPTLQQDFSEGPVFTSTTCDLLYCVPRSPFLTGPTDPSVGAISTCTIALQPCASDCDFAPVFDASSNYIVSVLNQQEYFSRNSELLFSVTAQIVGNDPIALVDSVPMRGEAIDLQYSHFSFDISSVPANSRLVLSAYTNAGSMPLEFFANYFNGEGSPVLAGSTQDCYGQFFCDVCVMDPAGDNNRCTYEVPPCVLSQQAGTYYLAVRNQNIRTSTDFVPNAPYQDGYYQGAYDSVITTGRNIDFTVEARIIEIIDVLEAERVLIGSLSSEESAFYRINTPSDDLSILRIEFEATTPNVVVAVSSTMPDAQCAACADLITAAEGDRIISIFLPCDLPDDVLYLSVTVDPSVVVDDCDRFDFIVHASTSTASQVEISLSSSDVDEVVRIFDNTDAEVEDQLIVRPNEFIVYEFDVTAQDGQFLVIETTQDDTGDVAPYSAFLSFDSPFFPAGVDDDFNVRSGDEDCGVDIAVNTCVDEEDDTCLFIVEPCEFTSGTYYLTFSGVGQDLDEETAPITLVIRQFDVEVLENTPATGIPAINVIAFNDTDAVFGDDILYRSVRTPAFGLSGGERLIISGSSIVDNMYVRRGDEVSSTGACPVLCNGGDTCTLFACDSVSSDPFYIFIEVGDTDVDITLTFTIDIGASGLDTDDIDIDANTDGSPAMTFIGLGGAQGDFDAEFQYYTISVDRDDIDSFELMTSNTGDLWFIPEDGDRLYFPGFVADDTDQEYALLDGEATADGTCGQFVLDLPSGRCCFESRDYTFAVVGTSGDDYDIDFVAAVIGGQTSDINLPENIEGEIELEDMPAFDQYTFDLDTDEAIYFTFEVTAGEATLYLKQGNNAGSDSGDEDDPSSCFGEGGVVSFDLCDGTVEPSDGVCAVHVTPCSIGGCPAFGEDSVTYTFAVVPEDGSDVTYNLNIESYTYVEDLDSDQEVPFFEPLLTPDNSQGDDIISVFRYQIPDDFLEDDRIPASSSLITEDDLDSDLLPHITITFTNFRLEGADDADPFLDADDFTVEAGDTSCSFDDLGSFCVDSDSSAENTTCVLQPCEAESFVCGQEIFFSVEAPDNNVYEFEVVIDEAFDGFDDSVVTFEFDDVSVTGSGSSSDSFDVDPDVRAVYLSTTFSGVDAGEYIVMTLSIESPDDIDFEFNTFSGSCAAAVPVPDCETVASNSSCTITFDPCTASAFGVDEDYTVLFEIYNPEGAATEWSYDFEIDVISIEPLDEDLTTLDVDEPTYTQTKNIFDNQWQFYEFTVEENDGYSSIEVTIDNLLCQSSGGDIDVYFNWGDSGGYGENARPNRFPTEDCNVQADEAVSSAASFADMDTCQFRGGVYRVGVFAPVDTQLFGEDGDDTVLPVVYTISATLTVVDHIEAVLGCSLVQVAAQDSFVTRIEIPVEATNFGASLFFGLESEGVTETLTLEVNREGHSAGTDTACAFDTATTTYGTCDSTAGAFCLIEIDACGYSDGKWFAYITGLVTDDGEATVTFASYIDYPYIPVYDLAVSGSVDATFAVQQSTIATDVGSTTSPIQWFKVILDATAEFEISIPDCNDCEITVEFFFGEHAAGTCEDGCDCDSPCLADDSCVATPASPCTQLFTRCETDADVVFVAVRDSTEACDFRMTITSFTPDVSTATALIPGQVNCDITGCDRVFELTVPDDDIANFALTVTIVNDNDFEIEAILSTDFLCPEVTIVPADDFAVLTISGCNSITGDLFLFVRVADCFSCLTESAAVSVSFEINDITVVDLEIGEPLAEDAVQARLEVPAGDFVNVIGSAVNYVVAQGAVIDFSAAECAQQCDRVINGGEEGVTVIFDSPLAGFVVAELDVETITDDFDVVFDAENAFYHFAYDVPSGATSITIHFDDVEFGAIDGDELSDIVVSFDSSTSNVPFLDNGSGVPCTGDCGSLPTLTAAACDAQFDSMTIDVCGFETLYFSIGVCDIPTCPVTMTLQVEVTEATEVELIDGTDHNDDYTTVVVASSNSFSCDDAPEAENLDFAVEVSSFLYVAIREPFSSEETSGVLATASASYEVCGSKASSCSVEQESSGIVTASCAVGSSDCVTSYCVAPGTYSVSFTAPSAGPASFEYQILTEYVELASSASASIIGQAAHFYRISDADQALSIDLTITSGPAVEFTVMEACSEVLDASLGEFTFKEYQVCSFGVCHVWIPTAAKNPGQSELYVVIESGSLDATVLANTNYEKETIYEIEVTRGTDNCASPPSTGFCADTFTSISNGMVWDFDNVTARNEQAECLYDSLADTCPSPTDLCDTYLRQLACLTVFPQCDSSGYQMGVCNDICLQVVDVCGDFEVDSRGAFECSTGRYAPGSNGTCTTGLPINGEEEVGAKVVAQAKVEAVAEIDVLPAQLVVPVFPPLYATLPTLVLDDDDAKMLVREHVEENPSSAPAMTMCFALFAVILLAF